VKIILAQAMLEVTCNTAGGSRSSGDGQNYTTAHKDMPRYRTESSRVVKDKPGQGQHWLSFIKGRYAMQKGKTTPNARPGMKKGQGGEMDKDGDCTPGKQRIRGDAAWREQTHATSPPSPPTCQSPNLLTQQQTKGS
jgi:hypothetical protein